jgi:hypothetical protein
MIDKERLGTYLQDHYAGSSAGAELFRRAAQQQSDPVARTELTAMVEEVENDRATLERVAEKLSRLKPNGELLHRSPLSDVIELEALRLAVEGKAAGWRVLRRLAEDEDDFDRSELDRLLSSAANQIDRLEKLRMAAAERVFLRN